MPSILFMIFWFFKNKIKLDKSILYCLSLLVISLFFNLSLISFKFLKYFSEKIEVVSSICSKIPLVFMLFLYFFSIYFNGFISCLYQWLLKKLVSSNDSISFISNVSNIFLKSSLKVLEFEQNLIQSERFIVLNISLFLLYNSITMFGFNLNTILFISCFLIILSKNVWINISCFKPSVSLK